MDELSGIIKKCHDNENIIYGTFIPTICVNRKEEAMLDFNGIMVMV